MRSRGVDILEGDLASFEARLKVFGSLWTAVTGHRPEPQDLPVRLFATQDRYHPQDVALLTGEDRDWPELGLRDFRAYDVPVTHREMLRHEPTLLAIESALVELDATVDRPAAPPAPASRRARPASAAPATPGTDDVLELGRGPALPDERRMPVHEQIALHMRAHPERPAVSSGDLTLTYGRLDAWAARLAGELTAAGVTPESRVGVLAEASAAMVAAVLAILRCGAAYVPVDTAHPDRRIDTVLSDAGVAALTVTPATDTRAVAAGLPRVCADPSLLVDETATPEAEAVGVGGDDIAYLIYTSGSTGEPKGVLVGHGELAASTLARRTVYPGEPVFLLVSPLAFDSSVAGLWGTLTAGGHLVVATAQEVRDPALLARLITRHGVTHLLCVPSLYAVLLDAVELTGPAATATLRTVTVAGEPLPEPLMERHFAVHGDAVTLFNEYGPTEATVWASYARFDAPAPVTIGGPVPGTRLYVLDEERRPVPVGVTGELHIGGAGVSRGYHGRPEATERVFLPDPFADAGPDGTPARMYRTGDLVRWNTQGTLDFVGRRDHQVKIRGHRVELGAVEAHLASLPGVREAVVVPNSASTGLLAFALVPGPDQPDAVELRDRLTDLLPEPMVPERITVLAAFPRTVNGKVDRAALIRQGAVA
ncbi:amino acid adenylation domain-containing protein [Streptomyces purpureus]|uniref:Amino acid adenylation domain-containing protein n=1 Tax=Streptomyces purpureus TaxID=1951 RepID=A0A918LM18_9ACTN|nr:amino acid adenylation domain-containing protein [Streptomyces purpureus]GGT16067.1 hypothetical protein GCM10014713_06210 [Streptomyces purpureus]